jgi:hypothetical protein
MLLPSLLSALIYVMLAVKHGAYMEMPNGPRGEKRHADVNRNAVLIAKIATGEIDDDLPTAESEGKNPAAVALGRMGGKARAEGLSAKKRRDIAKKAAESRWKKAK